MLFTSDDFGPYDEGDPHALMECNEGVLEWVPKNRLSDLNLWPGDKIFFKLLDEDKGFFSLKLVYDKDNIFFGAVLNGCELDLKKVFDAEGNVIDGPLEGAYK